VSDRRTFFALVVLVILIARLFWIAIAQPASGADFAQFWTLALGAPARGVTNPYSAEARQQLLVSGLQLAEQQDPRSARLDRALKIRRTIESFSTPFLYLAFVPWSGPAYDESLDRYRLFSLACLLLGAALLCRLAGLDWAFTCAALLALIWFSDSVIADAQVANVNTVQLALLGLYVWLARELGTVRQLAAGAVLGVLVAFKPTLGLIPLFLALGWLFRGERERLVRQGVGVTAAVALAVLASSVWLGSGRAWLDWAAGLGDLEQISDVRVNAGNFGLPRMLSELGAAETWPFLLGGLTVVFAVCAWRGSRRESPAAFDRDFLVVGLACAVSLLALRLAWVHYFVLAAPLALCLLGRVGSRVEGLAVAAASLLALGGPLRTFMPNADLWQQAVGLVTGTSLLALIGFAKLASSRA